jgi:hypothetical protein
MIGSIDDIYGSRRKEGFAVLIKYIIRHDGLARVIED